MTLGRFLAVHRDEVVVVVVVVGDSGDSVVVVGDSECFVGSARVHRCAPLSRHDTIVIVHAC